MEMGNTSAHGRRAVLERGGRHAKFSGNGNAEFVAEEPDDCVVMDGVADAIGELPPDVGVHGNGLRRAIPDAANHLAVARKCLGRTALERPQRVAGGDACVGNFALHPQISFTSVVVDFARAESLDETFKVFEHVAVVSADGGVERGVRGSRLCRVFQREEQLQALRQNVFGGSNQFVCMVWRFGRSGELP